jgi:hypothetical protein
MDGNMCIKVWMPDSVPERLQQAAGLLEEKDGVSTEFVAHVPAAILATKAYRRWNKKSGAEGWMAEGEIGLFGTNALDVYPHPDGDGILIVGSCV